MSYTPTEWESTDVVTATRMNALEQAVGDMNMSYTPNTWSDGDILSAEKMNALEQAVASGGGGSSDFSTAQVVIGEGVSGMLEATLVDVSEEWELPEGSLPLVLISKDITSSSRETFDVCLYNGHTLFYDYSGVAVTGNITLLTTAQDTPIYDITGDCTITIS